jgi:hypothetical protein
MFSSILNPQTQIAPSSFPLVDQFLDELSDRLHVHPLRPIDKRIAQLIALRPAIPPWDFVLGNVDSQ